MFLAGTITHPHRTPRTKIQRSRPFQSDVPFSAPGMQNESKPIKAYAAWHSGQASAELHLMLTQCAGFTRKMYPARPASELTDRCTSQEAREFGPLSDRPWA